ncbi:MAG: type II toxin-antitoxin system Phd/YefM family antitoxin [Verrucomicrobiales bacterium]
MRTATIREVQHHLNKVLAWVENGEEVQVTRRNKPVAKIVPAKVSNHRAKLPDFAARAAAIWGEKPAGKTISQTVIDDREERV